MTTFPAFFEQVPGITLYDPLADLLGAAQGGLVHYGYADAVRLAGHSCPTVASAYWLGLRAIRCDTGQSVLAQVHLQDVAGNPKTRHLMPLCLTGQASAEERTEFGQLWQDRVRRILLEHAHDDAVFSIRSEGTSPAR